MFVSPLTFYSAHDDACALRRRAGSSGSGRKYVVEAAAGEKSQEPKVGG